MSSDIEDRLEEMQGKVVQLKGSLQTVEATKNALVMPFMKNGEKLLSSHAIQLYRHFFVTDARIA